MTRPINEKELKQESITAQKQTLKSTGASGSSGGGIVSSAQSSPAIKTNSRYKQPDSFLDDVRNRYL